MDISIIIVNYNVTYFLEQCILSIIAASKNLKVEIIVVDNNSTDESCSMLQKKFPMVKLIANKINVGFSKANNQGVEIASGKYVLILNPDTVVAEDTFEHLLRFIKLKNNVGVIGVKLIDGAGNFLPESKRSIPTPKVSFNKLFGISNTKTGAYYATHLTKNETGTVDVLVGAFMFMKRSVYKEVEGFDEDYFMYMYGEDIDLSYKILKKGYKNYYYHNTQVIHYKGESTKKNIKYLNYFLDAMKIFYRKHFTLSIFHKAIISLGIEIWYLSKFFKFRFYSNNKVLDYKNLLFLGKDISILDSLKDKYVKVINSPLVETKNIKELIKKNAVEIIVFDNESISNKQIISALSDLKNENVVFKIRPRLTHFLIGSFCSVNRGEVEVLKEI